MIALSVNAYPFERQFQHIQQRLDGQNVRSIPSLMVEGHLLLGYFEGQQRRGFEASLAKGRRVGANPQVGGFHFR